MIGDVIGSTLSAIVCSSRDRVSVHCLRSALRFIKRFSITVGHPGFKLGHPIHELRTVKLDVYCDSYHSNHVPDLIVRLIPTQSSRIKTA